MTGEAPRASTSPDDSEREVIVHKSRSIGISECIGTSVEAVSDDKPDPDRLASVEAIHLIASKGWLPERKLMVIHDFFMARGLYADFNNFIRGMR